MLLFLCFFALIPLGIVVGIIIEKIYPDLERSEKERRAEENRLNDAAPVQVLPVRIAGGRMIMEDNNPDFAFYYLRFEAPDGSSREMEVDRLTYHAFGEGMTGELTYQRKRFLSFTPKAMAGDAQYPQGYPAQQMPVQQPYIGDDLDPAMFERRYPDQNGQDQMPIF